MPFESGVGGGGEQPRLLWLTWVDPQPERDGQRMYSGRLIDAVANTGAGVDVLCFASDGRPDDGSEDARRAVFRTVAPASRPGWASLLSPLPNVAYRCAVPRMTAQLRTLLGLRQWRAVVLDGLASGWALSELHAAGIVDDHEVRVVHVSHNHEATTRGRIAENYDGNPVMKRVLRHDAAKAARLERQMVEGADLVTAITREDAARFQAEAPDKPVLTLPPGYAGPRLDRRRITPDTPRVAVIVGSFHWIAKRMNLEAFFEMADPLFEAAGIRLRVVGGGPPGFVEELQSRSRATEFLGAVADIEPYLEDARVAIVPELSGGGFKLKLLDYVFRRLPVLAIDGSLAGAPLRPEESALAFATFEELARGVITAIDDIELLNRLQTAAFDACDGRFDWSQRGELLVEQAVSA